MNYTTQTPNENIATLTWADKRRELAWELFHKRARELSPSESGHIDNILGRG